MSGSWSLLKQKQRLEDTPSPMSEDSEAQVTASNEYVYTCGGVVLDAEGEGDRAHAETGTSSNRGSNDGPAMKRLKWQSSSVPPLLDG